MSRRRAIKLCRDELRKARAFGSGAEAIQGGVCASPGILHVADVPHVGLDGVAAQAKCHLQPAGDLAERTGVHVFVAGGGPFEGLEQTVAISLLRREAIGEPRVGFTEAAVDIAMRHRRFADFVHVEKGGAKVAVGRRIASQVDRAAEAVAIQHVRSCFCIDAHHGSPGLFVGLCPLRTR